MSKNELHRCPFSAQITRLDVCNFKDDYINLNDDDIDGMKNKMRSFLFDKKYLKACGYCPGRKLSDPQIKPAIQTKKPLEYKKYLE